VYNLRLLTAQQAQISLGHDFADPPPPTVYLSVDEELLLLRHYCSQASRVVRDGFQLPESLESTALSYLKRFYLKNSVMEWHPKVIMFVMIALNATFTN
jgi:cyclin H